MIFLPKQHAKKKKYTRYQVYNNRKKICTRYWSPRENLFIVGGYLFSEFGETKITTHQVLHNSAARRCCCCCCSAGVCSPHRKKSESWLCLVCSCRSLPPAKGRTCYRETDVRAPKINYEITTQPGIRNDTVWRRAAKIEVYTVRTYVAGCQFSKVFHQGCRLPRHRNCA